MFSKREPARIEVIRCESNELRLDEWRKHDELIRLAESVWVNQDFRLMIQVAQNESPANFAILSGNLEDRAIQQARSEGFNLFLATLKTMRVPADKIETLETTYEPETQD